MRTTIITVTNMVAILLAISVKTASAAMLTIDLTQALDTLLQDHPELCTENLGTTECLLPTFETGGVTVDDFINISSSNGASLTSTAGVTDIALNAASADDNPLIADFRFDITRALVSQISFEVGDPETLGCTVFEFTGSSSFDCSGSMGSTSPFMVTSDNSIIRLELADTENFAYDFKVTYTAVPVPASFVLFLSGLAGLVGVTGRKQRS